MKSEIYIFNSPGCHGHYLTYLIDRYSKKTPAIKELPFNSLGNSHKKINYSGFSTFVDVHEHNAYKNLKTKKIIKILYDKDILYYERVAMNRAGDSNRDIYNLHKDISFLKTYNNGFYNTIYKLYSIKSDSVPKWLLRDAYKLGFLDWNNQGSVVNSKQDIRWVKDNLESNNNVYFLNVNAFFDTKTLKNELQKLSKTFELDLSLENLDETHLEFLKSNKILQTHKYTDIVLDAVKKQENIEIPILDIIQQAFIYAELEKQYNTVLMPLVNNFFDSTYSINEYIKNFPNWYKKINPNLPK